MKIKPLQWISQFQGTRRRARLDGWYGKTAYDHTACFVYNVWIKRKSRWFFHCYLGRERPGKQNNHGGAGYRSAKAAKEAAQRWWRRTVKLMIEEGGAP